MKTAENVLNEFEETVIKRSKFYNPTLILTGIFICLAALDMFIDFERLRWKEFYFDWFDFIMLLVIPAAGLFLIIKKTTAGWFISTLYFSFIASLAILSTGQAILQNTGAEFPITVRQLIILIITVLISIFLQTKSLRVHFNIYRLLWIATVIISLCLAVALITFG
jgi:hypothetical protein